VLGAVVVVALLAVVATHSVATRMVVLPRLASALGMDVTARSVSIEWNGNLVLRDAHFRAPGVAGPAGQFLMVDRAVADVDWGAVVSGKGMPARSVELRRPVVVISQSTEDRVLNVSALAQSHGGGGGGGAGFSLLTLPRVTLIDAAIELGEHAGGSYKALKRLTMNGSVIPGDKAGSYVATLRQADRASPSRARSLDTAMRVDATLEPGEIKATLTNFNLSEWPAETLPMSAREVLQDMELSGDVPSASVRYTDATGVEAELRVRGVAMNLPLAPDPSFTASGAPLEGPPRRLMRMRGVDGKISFARDTVRARVQGLIEDLPYEVSFRYEGTTTDAPFALKFTSENFRVDRNPALLPYAPPVVRTWLNTFSSPTALLTADVNVTRGEPGVNGPAALRVAGTIDLKQGTAAYDRFPYAFNDMAGRFKFDNDSLEVVGMTGRSASGATISADARIAPLDETSEVKVDVKVRGAPIDAAMEEAFGRTRGDFIQSLFNTRAYHELVASGLVRTPGDASAEAKELERLRGEPVDGAGHENARERIAQLEARSVIPVFELGGAADVDINIFSPRGANVPWHTNIDIRIAKAGLVPEKFPLPIVARDVVAHVLDESGSLVSGDFRGLTGGSAKVSATFGIPSSKGESATGTEIVIEATGLPFDVRAIHALPVPSSGTTDVRKMLADLNVSALLGGTVRIANRAEQKDHPIGFDADLSFAGAKMEPKQYPRDPAIVGDGISGSVKANENEVRMDLAGRVRRGDGASGTGDELGASLEYFGDQDAQKRASRFTASMGSLDLSLPMQSLVWVFSPPAAESLHELWSKYQPSGRVDLALSAQLPGGGRSLEVTAEARAKSETMLTVAGRSIQLGFAENGSTGVVRVRQGAKSRVEFVDFHVPMRVRGAETKEGTVSIEGWYPLGKPGAGDEASELLVKIEGSPIESPLVSEALSQAMAKETVDSLMGLHPRGVFDAELKIAAEAPDPLKAIPDRVAPRVTGAVRPKSLSLEMNGTSISFPVIEGSIEFEPGSGVVRRLKGSAPTWSVGVDGAWSSGADGSVTMKGDLSGRAESLSPDLLAALPEELRSVVSQLDLHVGGAMSLEETTVSLSRGGENPKTEIAGVLKFENASMQAGVGFAEMDGSADFGVTTGDRSRARFTVGIAAKELRVSGARVREARALIESQNDGGVTVRDVEGEIHDGRLVGRVEMGPSETDGSRGYEVDLRLAGVRFKPLLDDMEAGSAGENAGMTESQSLSRGVLDANVSLMGRTGADGSRRGRGEFRIARKGSNVLNIPVLLRLVEASNLVLPLGDSLDLVRSKFYIDANTVVFETLDAYSRAIVLAGYGTMTLPGRELDLRFNSESARPIPVISWLVEGIRDSLVSTAVTGTLDNPKVSLVNLPGPRRAIERTIGAPTSDQSSQMIDLEKRAESLREERNRGKSRIVPRATAEESMKAGR
jgi:hypothetical protein